MTSGASRVDGPCSFGWWRMLGDNDPSRQKGSGVNTRVTAEPLRKRGAPGQIEVRRLRAGVFRLGGYLGFDTQTVVRFSEAISGQRWRRCRRADLEQVAADSTQIAGRMRLMKGT